MPAHRNTRESVWRRVEQRGPDECWPFIGTPNSHGYGEICVAHTMHLAHRLTFELATGIEPGGLFVLHRCDNRRCCNPGHLFLGTHADNMADMTAKGRQPRGDRHGRRRLTEAAVKDIRTAHTNGARFVDLAGVYGVTPENVSMICRRQTWRHVA